MSRTRILTAGLAVAALLATAVPASAATDTFVAEASSAAVTLSLAGNDLLEVGATFAAVVPGEAVASAIPAALGGTPVGERAAGSDGAAVTDPAEATDRCLAAIPTPLDALVGAGLACADAYAEGDVPAASATAGVAALSALDVDAADLAPIHELLATLPLGELVDQIETQLLSQLQEAFGDVRAECISALEPLNVGGLLDPVLADLPNATPEDVAAILTTLEDLLGALVPAACDVLGGVADLVLSGDLLETITSADILDTLAGAEGVLSVTLLETASEAVRDGDAVVAAAGPVDGGAIAIVVDIPLLEELLGGLLEDTIAPAVESLTTLLEPVADAVEPIPAVGELVASLLSGELLGDLLEGPLLVIGVVPGEAVAEGDLAAGETSGDASPALVELGGSLFALPLLSDLGGALDEVAGQLDDSLLAALRDSPLVDVVSVELLPESVTDGDVDGLAGTEAIAGTASVQVLGVLAEPAGGALVDLEVAPAVARVGVGDAETPPPGTTPPTTPTTPVPPVTPSPTPATPAPTPRELPATGGGAALLGLAALGAAASLRRRG